MATIALPSTTRLAAGLARRGIHYGWLVAAVTFLTMLSAAAIRSMPGVLMLSFEREFHWDRAVIGIAIALNLLLYGCMGPVVGYMMDRYGPRLVAISAITLLALGALATTTMTQIWQLDVYWGFVVGAGAGGVGMVLVGSVVNRWFDKRRGTLTGVLGAATSAGQIIFVPLIAWLSVTVGWRVGVLVAAGLLGLVVLPLLLLVFRNDPSQVGLRRYGESAASTGRAAAATGQVDSTPMRQVIRTPEFWWLAGGLFVCGYTTNGLIGTHFLAHAADHGIAEVTAASVQGLMGGVNILGTIGAGMLADRVRNRNKLLVAFYAFRGLSLFYLPFIQDVRMLTIFAILYGLNWFGTAPVSQLIAADVFGRRAVGRVYGFMFLGHQMGGSLAAITGGLVHDWFGDYQIAFLSAGLAGLVAAGLSMQIREHRRKPVPEPVPA
ncbi:MAG TPA: MFS transporter [Chloroflexota bacterium]|nr:MFS transporter [Chloroflexota bacterium]